MWYDIYVYVYSTYTYVIYNICLSRTPLWFFSFSSCLKRRFPIHEWGSHSCSPCVKGCLPVWQYFKIYWQFSTFIFSLVFMELLYFTRLCWPIQFIFGSLPAIKSHTLAYTHTHTHSPTHTHINIYTTHKWYVLYIIYINNASWICIEVVATIYAFLLSVAQRAGSGEGDGEGQGYCYIVLWPQHGGQRPKWIMSICQAFRFLRLMRISLVYQRRTPVINLNRQASIFLPVCACGCTFNEWKTFSQGNCQEMNHPPIQALSPQSPLPCPLTHCKSIKANVACADPWT